MKLLATVEVEADMVVLAVGLEPGAAGEDVAHMLKLSRTGDGFLAEAHPKLRPVDTTSDGVFLAGTCQGPKDIPDTVAQAKAAASSALIPLSMGKAKVEAIVSFVDQELCVGCALCENACAYGALSMHPWRGIMTVNEVLCKGCGACSVACPSFHAEADAGHVRCDPDLEDGRRMTLTRLRGCRVPLATRHERT